MQDTIIIREAASLDEFEQVAAMHIEYINAGFLSTLGVRVLSRLYKFLAEDRESVLYVAMDDATVAGYVSGTINVDTMFSKFIKKNLSMAFLVLPKIFSFARLKRVIETLFYPSKNKKLNLPSAELLSIAVARRYQGKTISVDLYHRLVQYFENYKISKFKIIVGSRLKGPLKYYDRVGAKKFTEIEVHKGEKSWVLVHEISGVQP